MMAKLSTMTVSFNMPCDRSEYLAERDAMREERKQLNRCHKINTRPGFQTIANMKFKKE